MNTTDSSHKLPRRSGRALLAVGTTATMSLLLSSGPALATEAEHVKTTLPESQHDLVGLVLLVITGIAALAGLANARRQLKGERDQASGEFRWR